MKFFLLLVNPMFWIRNSKLFASAIQKGWNQGVANAFKDVDS